MTRELIKHVRYACLQLPAILNRGRDWNEEAIGSGSCNPHRLQWLCRDGCCWSARLSLHARPALTRCRQWRNIGQQLTVPKLLLTVFSRHPTPYIRGTIPERDAASSLVLS